MDFSRGLATDLETPPVFDLPTFVQIHLGHKKAIINSRQTLCKENEGNSCGHTMHFCPGKLDLLTVLVMET